jgi:RNA polymerase sigma-70 factor (ECF subfamily)
MCEPPAEIKIKRIQSDPTGEDLIRGLLRAEEPACAALCRRFGPALHGFAAAQLAGDNELAEEVVIRALADAARNIGQFNPEKSSLATWLYGIVRRQIQGELRKQKRRSSVPPSAQVSLEAAAEIASDHDTSADTLSQLEAQRKVAELAAVLSEAEMEVLNLHYVEEFSLKEIAKIIGRSEGAVESLLHRAKQKARESQPPAGE